MSQHPIVSREQWLAARREHLRKEKEVTRLRDEVNRQRRELPWVRVEEPYVFDGPAGKETLADLFDGRSQLIVQHFMFGPGWKEGCKSCSFQADHVDGALVHLAHRDATFVAISRAPLAEIAPFQTRMGWRFKWVSSHANDFNFDYHVSFTEDDKARGEVYYNYGPHKFVADELHGTSVFHKDEAGDVFHTYSAYARGVEPLIGTYMYLDLVPQGRDEDGLAFSMSWLRHHDRYDGNED